MLRARDGRAAANFAGRDGGGDGGRRESKQGREGQDGAGVHFRSVVLDGMEAGNEGRGEGGAGFKAGREGKMMAVRGWVGLT